MSTILIQTSCEDEACAREIGRELVKRQLAACVSIIPISASIYRWQGKFEEVSEFQLCIKSDSSLASRLEEVLLELHPYQTPEFMVSSVDHVSPSYLAWLNESLGVLSDDE